MFKFCRIEETNLVCYPDGLILRFHKYQKNGKYAKVIKEKMDIYKWKSTVNCI